MTTEIIPIVCVTYNDAHNLRPWFESISNLSQEGFRAAPVVMDNASRDDTPAVVGQAIKRGIINRDDVYWLSDNYGHTKAFNAAVARLSSKGHRFFASVDPDATFGTHWLRHLARQAYSDAGKGVGM